MRKLLEEQEELVLYWSRKQESELAAKLELIEEKIENDRLIKQWISKHQKSADKAK